MKQADKLTELLKMYVTEKILLWQAFPLADVAKACEVVWRAYESQGTIYACGNGGTTSVAANMINDFNTVPFMPDSKDTILEVAKPRLRAVNLGESSAAITATMNDLGPEYIFSEELKVQGIRKGDVLLALSGSGNSANILAAVRVAQEQAATVIGITRKPESRLLSAADIGILITGTSNYPGQSGGNNFNFHFEDTVSAIGHMITGVLKERIQEHASFPAKA